MGQSDKCFYAHVGMISVYLIFCACFLFKSVVVLPVVHCRQMQKILREVKRQTTFLPLFSTCNDIFWSSGEQEMGFQLVPAATKVLYSNAVQHLQSLNPDTGDPQKIIIIITVINCLLTAYPKSCQHYLQGLLLPDEKKGMVCGWDIAKCPGLNMVEPWPKPRSLKMRK